MQFEEKAERMLKKTMTSMFMSAIGYKDNLDTDDALELFLKAAYEYKLQKDYLKSISTFERCLSLCNYNAKRIEILSQIVDCCKIVGLSQDIIFWLKKQASAYNEKMDFNNMAKCYNDIARQYETDGNIEKALTCYIRELEILTVNNRHNDIAKRCDELGKIYGRLNEYERAADCFDKAIKEWMHPDNNNGYISKRLTALNQMLCILAIGDCVKAKRIIEKYEELDRIFINSYESKFIRGVVQCMEEMNAENLGDICYNYDRVVPLDAFKVSALLIIKQNMNVEYCEEIDLS